MKLKEAGLNRLGLLHAKFELGSKENLASLVANRCCHLEQAIGPSPVKEDLRQRCHYASFCRLQIPEFNTILVSNRKMTVVGVNEIKGHKHFCVT